MTAMRGGFLRFSLKKEQSSQDSIDKAMRDFRRWLDEQPGRPQVLNLEQTDPKSGVPESTPNLPPAPTPEMPGAISGQPELKDFGVTPEEVASYRSADCQDRWSLGFFLFGLLLCYPVLLLIDRFLDGHCYIALALAAAAFAVWGLLRLSHYDPRSRQIRGRVRAYLCAKAEYEKAVKQAELEQRRRQEYYWRSLSGRDFETEMARLYKLAGYTVETTPVSGDQGADLLLRKDGELIVVQCKRQDKPVGPHIVRDLYGTMHHFQASRASLDATGGFTKAVRQYVRGKPIELHDLDYILSMQERLSRKSESPEPGGR